MLQQLEELGIVDEEEQPAPGSIEEIEMTIDFDSDHLLTVEEIADTIVGSVVQVVKEYETANVEEVAEEVDRLVDKEQLVDVNGRFEATSELMEKVVDATIQVLEGVETQVGGELVVDVDVDVTAPPISETEEEVVESAVDVIEKIIKDCRLLIGLEDGAEVNIDIDIDLNGDVEPEVGQEFDLGVVVDFQGFRFRFLALMSTSNAGNYVDVPESRS